MVGPSRAQGGIRRFNAKYDRLPGAQVRTRREPARSTVVRRARTTLFASAVNATCLPPTVTVRALRTIDRGRPRLEPAVEHPQFSARPAISKQIRFYLPHLQAPAGHFAHCLAILHAPVHGLPDLQAPAHFAPAAQPAATSVQASIAINNAFFICVLLASPPRSQQGGSIHLSHRRRKRQPLLLARSDGSSRLVGDHPPEQDPRVEQDPFAGRLADGEDEVSASRALFSW